MLVRNAFCNTKEMEEKGFGNFCVQKAKMALGCFFVIIRSCVFVYLRKNAVKILRKKGQFCQYRTDPAVITLRMQLMNSDEGSYYI